MLMCSAIVENFMIGRSWGGAWQACSLHNLPQSFEMFHCIVELMVWPEILFPAWLFARGAMRRADAGTF